MELEFNYKDKDTNIKIKMNKKINKTKSGSELMKKEDNLNKRHWWHEFPKICIPWANLLLLLIKIVVFVAGVYA